MLGLILCGGQSSRMGTDKGLLKLHTHTWAKTAAGKINTLSLPVVISINPGQYEDYSEIFPASQLITDNEKLPLRGPLLGVLSAHLQYPGEDFIILACDMPLLETSLLKELLTLYQVQPEPDAFIYTNDGEPEPLCGIYKAKGLSHIIQLYQAGQLIRHSMKYALEYLSTTQVPLSAEQKNSFRNFNAHSELNGL